MRHDTENRYKNMHDLSYKSQTRETPSSTRGQASTCGMSPGGVSGDAGTPARHPDTKGRLQFSSVKRFHRGKYKEWGQKQEHLPPGVRSGKA